MPKEKSKEKYEPEDHAIRVALHYAGNGVVKEGLIKLDKKLRSTDYVLTSYQKRHPGDTWGFTRTWAAYPRKNGRPRLYEDCSIKSKILGLPGKTMKCAAWRELCEIERQLLNAGILKSSCIT